MALTQATQSPSTATPKPRSPQIPVNGLFATIELFDKGAVGQALPNATGGSANNQHASKSQRPLQVRRKVTNGDCHVGESHV